MSKPKKWIQKSGIGKHKGALHRALGVPTSKRIPDRKLIAAMRLPGHVGRMAREAGTLRGLKHHTGPRKRRKLTHRRSR